MLIGLYADPHFSASSNIISMQDGWHGRLSNLIKSINWMNELFEKRGVERIICLGDLTDRTVLNSEEITALSKCDFSSHEFIVGNHCRSDKNGSINTLGLLNVVYPFPYYITNDKSIMVLPYNSDLVDLGSFEPKPKIILSHNDIYNYNFGDYISKEGYHIEDILANCQLFINGHLHNGGWVVRDRIMNLGCISGINFSSCGGEWNPSVAIVDTDTLKVELIENPYAYKFRKKTLHNLPELKAYIESLEGNNYVLQVKIPHRILNEAKTLIGEYDKIVAHRIIFYADDKKEMKIENIIKQNDTVSPDIKLHNYVVEKKPDTYDIRIFEKILDKIKA